MEKNTHFAQELLEYGRNKLLLKMRFMALPFSKLKPSKDVVGELVGEKGEKLYYDGDKLILAFAKEENAAARLYLHMVFHCLFKHIFLKKQEERLWFLACDMAVEYAILELNLPQTSLKNDELEKLVLKSFVEKVEPFNDDTLYRYFLTSKLTNLDIRRLESLFQRDIHYYQGDDEEEDNSGDEGEIENELARENAFDFLDDKVEKDAWDDISKEVETELQNFANELGDGVGAMIQNIRPLEERENEYRRFLQKFTRLSEALEVDNESFDYIYYTYGLTLYQDMPLIEPLETKEVRKIEELVIALDTSGSCSGEVVQAFLQETYDILTDGTAFFDKMHIRLIQCDKKIQSDTVIKSAKDFTDFIAHGELKGFGGTDFRPVFQYVDELIKKGTLRNLKGLLYFTDGLGIYPKKMPEYDTAFIFLKKSRYFDDPDFPIWAMKVLVSPNGLLERTQNEH